MSILDILGPLLGFGGAGVTGILDFFSRQGANAETLKRLEEVLDSFDQQQQNFDENIQPLFGQDAATMAENLRQRQLGLGDLSTDIQGQFGTLESDVTGGFADRRTRILAGLEGSGEQERRDIQGQFDASGSRLAQDATSRGLAGTTIMPGISAANERERSDALGGLEERLRQQTAGVDAQLSGDFLSAQERLGGQGINLAQGFGQQLIGSQFGGDEALRQNMFSGALASHQIPSDIQAGRNAVLSSVNNNYNPVPYGFYGPQGLGQFGQQPIDYPDAPKPNYWLPWVEAGANVGSSFI